MTGPVFPRRIVIEEAHIGYGDGRRFGWRFTIDDGNGKVLDTAFTATRWYAWRSAVRAWRRRTLTARRATRR